MNRPRPIPHKKISDALTLECPWRMMLSAPVDKMCIGDKCMSWVELNLTANIGYCKLIEGTG